MSGEQETSKGMMNQRTMTKRQWRTDLAGPSGEYASPGGIVVSKSSVLSAPSVAKCRRGFTSIESAAVIAHADVSGISTFSPCAVTSESSASSASSVVKSSFDSVVKTPFNPRGSVPSVAKCRRAFTLIELLAVIAIMAVLAAVAVPGFVALFRSNGQVQGVNQISAALGEAQTLAMRMHTYVALVMYEQPGYTGETAFAYEYAPVGQGIYNIVYFYPYLPRPVQYLPKGTYAAGLVGTATNSDGGLFMPLIVEKQFGGTVSVDTPRVVVFNGSGHLVVLNSVDVVEIPNALINPSQYGTYTVNVGPTSPALQVFNIGNWPKAINNTATPGYASPGAYALAHSNTLTVNTYTGGIIQ